MSDKSNKSVLFFRVSSKRQADEGHSLSAQERLGKEYLKSNKLKAEKIWSISESASKEKDRKHFYEMIEYVKENSIKNIVFDKVDRACRGYKAAYLVEELMTDFDVKFHFTRDNLVIDKYSPMSEKDRFGIGVWLGKRYTDNLRLEVIKGMKERELRGHWNFKAPIGYKNIRVKGRASVIKCEETSFYVAQVFEMYSTGNYTQVELVDYLKKNITSRKIGKTLVDKIISNPFYYGDMVIRGKTIKGKHEGLISKKLYDNCQRIRGIRAKKLIKNNSKSILKPLMGLLSCGSCGAAITGQSKKKASGKVYTYYHCANSKCLQKKKYTREEKILEQLTAAFTPFRSFKGKATKQFIKKLKKNAPNIDLHIEKKVLELNEKRARIKKKLLKIEKLRRDNILSEAEVRELIQNNQVLLSGCESEKKKVLDQEGTIFSEGLRVVELLRKSYDFMHLSKNLLDKAKLAKIVLSNPVLQDGNIEYHYEKPFDNLVKICSQKNWWR